MKNDGNSTWIFFSNELHFFLLFTAGTEEGYKKVWDINAKQVERVGAGKDYLHQKELVSNKVQNHEWPKCHDPRI